MRDFDLITRYAREKVETTQLPPSLYEKAQRRKNAIDSLVTVFIASVVLALSTTQVSSRATIQSPAVKKYIQQELVASRVNP